MQKQNLRKMKSSNSNQSGAQFVPKAKMKNNTGKMQFYEELGVSEKNA